MQSYGNYAYYGQPIYQQTPYPGPSPTNGYPPFNYPYISRPENPDQPVVPPHSSAPLSRPKPHRRAVTLPATSASYPLKSALKKSSTEDPQTSNLPLQRANTLTRSRTYSNPSNLVPGTDPAFRPRSSHLHILQCSPYI